jgi:membrane-associated phospholipid phosphatase
MHKPGSALLLLAVLLFPVQDAHSQTFRADLTRDGIILGTGVTLSVLSEILARWGPVGAPVGALEGAGNRTPDPSTIGPLDRMMMVPYSRQIDAASTVLEIASMGLPLLLGFGIDPDSLIPAGLTYAEVLTIANGAKSILKYLFARPRPYLFTGSAPGVDPTEDYLSFPSGHATVAFAGAAFAAYVYAQSQPALAPYLPVVALSASLATLTAAYRVAAGVHYLSDVAAGAALGFVLPSLLQRW